MHYGGADSFPCVRVRGSVRRCARNCPLYNKPVRYETLITALLRAADVI